MNMTMNNNELLDSIDKLCNEKEYVQARIMLESYLNDNKNDKKANYLMVRILTKDYTDYEVNEDFEQYFQEVLSKTPLSERQKLLKEYNDYIDNRNLYQDRKSEPENNKKSSFPSINFVVFIICLLFSVGLCLVCASQYLAGAIIIFISLIVGLIIFFKKMFTKKG